ncbi:phosphoglycerate mutase-like protein [Aspergillus uvarum CBS 121591]|uniref:Phosphoglycerate mutase-like protein n=1 Tax=Aspergillus uvarum CBS 121591 TaxID=1448315 RepID=A0A319BST4_9EURO|nr:phosphoglycerate mutase-like protein [Aspergillus uvarum CBS 121591]PYH75417.1 phosphoglycerate mutase-like protein [Aspergillus uvarum CBS 121591]
MFHHLGGNKPWIEKRGGMSRHGARYPTRSAGGRQIALLNRIRDANVKLNGSLSFLNNWTYFTDDPSTDFDQLTTTGSGPATATASSKPPDTSHPGYFSGSSSPSDWQESGKATLEVIPETFDRGPDTLTPGDTCLRYLEDTDHGHDYGIPMLARFQQAYIPAIAERLPTEQGNPALGPLSNAEVYSMQEMCGFETLVRGSSPWCAVFTREDWKHLEYARDVLHYYRAGPGNPYPRVMGWLWLIATTGLLRSGPDAGTLFLMCMMEISRPFLTALKIMADPKYDPELPVPHMVSERVWRTSSVMPMGGRVVLERMTCSSGDEGARGDAGNTFLRVVINEKVTPLPYCKCGPGLSCPLVDFVGYVDRMRLEVGEFGAVCGLDGDSGQVTFLRQD